MKARFVIFGLALAGTVGCAFTTVQAGHSSIFDVFLWLGLILVLCGVALWPATGPDQRAELELERPSWADHVEINDPGRAGRGSLPARGMPDGTRISRAG